MKDELYDDNSNISFNNLAKKTDLVFQGDNGQVIDIFNNADWNGIDEEPVLNTKLLNEIREDLVFTPQEDSFSYALENSYKTDSSDDVFYTKEDNLKSLFIEDDFSVI